MRRFVIGDIHGCSKALRTILEKLSPQSDDMIVFLGDFIDRGPDSRGVIDQVVELSRQCRVIPIRGNHELMLMGILFGGCCPEIWLQSGGAATVASYGGSLDRIPVQHRDFFRSLRAHHETESELFIHAGYQPDVSVERIDDAHRYWNHLIDVPPPHCSGKRVYVGHTPQASGKVLKHSHFVCLDTYCFGGGWLTAMDLDTDEVIQANRHGHLRRDLSLNIWKTVSRWLGRPAKNRGQVDSERLPGKVADGKQSWQRSAIPDNGSAP